MSTTASPQTRTQPSPATRITPTSWLQAAAAVLQVTGLPMRPPEIVAAAQQRGWAPPSITRTPAQSVGRDLRRAARRPSSGLAAGPGKGQFRSVGPAGGSQPTTTKAIWLPSAPLIRLIEASGGLAASGLRRHAGETSEHARMVKRLERSYQRARRGNLTVTAADELCIRVLGVHPFEVFGALWWDADAFQEGALCPPVTLPRAG